MGLGGFIGIFTGVATFGVYGLGNGGGTGLIYINFEIRLGGGGGGGVGIFTTGLGGVTSITSSTGGGGSSLFTESSGVGVLIFIMIRLSKLDDEEISSLSINFIGSGVGFLGFSTAWTISMPLPQLKEETILSSK